METGNEAYYSGNSLLWTPWGSNEVPCIERGPHFGVNLHSESIFETQQSVLNTEVS